jgi:hypothetical protein
MTFEQVLDGFRRRGIVRGGELLLTPGDALEVVSRCVASDLAVIGIEGMIVDDDYTTPQQDLIADCSSESAVTWSEYRDDANACSRAFLARLPARASLFVSLTGIGAGDWSRG